MEEEELDKYTEMRSFLIEELEIDPKYEFDAPRFYDFSQPETLWDAVEAEHWFDSAESCSPSPFVLRLRWGKSNQSGHLNTSAHHADSQNSKMVNDNFGHSMEYEVSAAEDDCKGNTKSLSKSSGSKCSTFMKPTLSHLAKQRNPSDILPSIRTSSSSGRPQSHSSSIDDDETKRQKIESGFLRKHAHLKHHAPFTHKTPKKVDLTDVNSSSRPKVTIPKEFDLETAHRAERHKSRTNESEGHKRSSSKAFKALPLNKKILEAPSLTFRKKMTSPLTEFHVFHFKTSERAMQHASSNDDNNSNCSSNSNKETKGFRRQNSNDASKQEKCRPVNKLGGSSENMRLSNKCERGVFRNIKQENVMGKTEPPSEQLSKLSLASEVKRTKLQSKEKQTSKGLKENRPGYFQAVHERRCEKQFHQRMNERSDVNHACLLAGACC